MFQTLNLKSAESSQVPHTQLLNIHFNIALHLFPVFRSTLFPFFFAYMPRHLIRNYLSKIMEILIMERLVSCYLPSLTSQYCPQGPAIKTHPNHAELCVSQIKFQGHGASNIRFQFLNFSTTDGKNNDSERSAMRVS